MQNLINGRCGWCGTDELYVAYHDNEWGRLVKEDKMGLSQRCGRINIYCIR